MGDIVEKETEYAPKQGNDGTQAENVGNLVQGHVQEGVVDSVPVKRLNADPAGFSTHVMKNITVAVAIIRFDPLLALRR